MLVATYDYWGYYNICFLGGEVRDPERMLPRATIYGTLAATLLYLIATVAIFGMIPTHALAPSNSPLARTSISVPSAVATTATSSASSADSRDA